MLPFFEYRLFLETACKNNTCQQICNPTPNGAYCSCREGYVLDENLHTCRDVDECAQGKCSQNCTNTPGGFTCICSEGYLLKYDGVTCKASGKSKRGEGQKRSRFE